MAAVTSELANVTVNGFTFQGWSTCAQAGANSVLTVYNCNFTAPTSGGSVMRALENGLFTIYGTCQYSGATPVAAIFGCAGCSSFGLGYDDGVFQQNLVFNIAGTPVVTDATVVSEAAGAVGIFNTVVAFTGGIPNCAQYACSTSGGINFSTGVTTIFPGTLPGVVVPPGWIN
jgi:hypothetical protein